VVAHGSSEIVRGIPYVNELIYWDPPTIHADSRGTHRSLGSKLKFIRDLRTRRFDKVYVLKRSFSSALMAWLTGAKERVGFNTEGRSFLLTKRVPFHPDRHEVVNFLDVLRADGVPVTDDHLELWVSPAEQDAAAAFLAGCGAANKPLLAIHPFGSLFHKTWPMERFAETAARLAQRHGFTPVILGGPRDRAQFDQARSLFPPQTCDLVGKHDLRMTLAVLARCSLFFGNDSGIMHLAAAVGVPVVAIFGPTSPTRFGPWGPRTAVLSAPKPCAHCREKNLTECEKAENGRMYCVLEISVDQAVTACDRMLETRTAEVTDRA
jgi:heptosyltransferase-2